MTAVYQQWLESPTLNKYGSKLPKLLGILLLILCAYTAAQLVWLILTPAPDLPHFTTQQKLSSKSSQQTDYASQIVNAHLFGTQQTSQPAQAVDAPVTRLNLKLRGVFAVEDESKGVALIAGSSGPEKMYTVGKKIPGNITLSAVYPDRVILKRNGQFETLYLPATKDTGKSFRPTGTGRRASQPNQSRVSNQGNKLRQIRRDFLRNPTKLAELVRVAPVIENGQTSGFRLEALKDDPLFKELGFQSGDIVKRVNGVDLDSSAKGLRVIQQLRRAKQVSVTIERNGQLVEMNHSF